MKVLVVAPHPDDEVLGVGGTITRLSSEGNDVTVTIVTKGVIMAFELPGLPYDHDALEPYIESARCTTCDECTRLNKRMFAYNEKKQAYIKDAKAGTFRELVQAAEKCPVKIIHPGTPLNPKEKNLKKWIKRAEPFN